MRHERFPPADAAEARLARALVAHAAASGVGVAVEHHRSRPWASATFVGARHEVALAGPDRPALAGWLAALPEAELTLPRHLVASVAVDEIEHGDGLRATLSILTIADP